MAAFAPPQTSPMSAVVDALHNGGSGRAKSMAAPLALERVQLCGSRFSEYENAFRIDVGTIHFMLNGRRYPRFVYEQARRMFDEQTETVVAFFFRSARHLVAPHVAGSG